MAPSMVFPCAVFPSAFCEGGTADEEQDLLVDDQSIASSSSQDFVDETGDISRTTIGIEVSLNTRPPLISTNKSHTIRLRPVPQSTETTDTNNDASG